MWDKKYWPLPGVLFSAIMKDMLLYKTLNFSGREMDGKVLGVNEATKLCVVFQQSTYDKKCDSSKCGSCFLITDEVERQPTVFLGEVLGDIISYPSYISRE